MLTPFDAQVDLFDRDGLAPAEALRPIWDILIPLGLVLLLLDVACRRIAWDRRSLAASAARAGAFVRSFTETRAVTGDPMVGALRRAKDTASERTKTDAPVKRYVETTVAASRIPRPDSPQPASKETSPKSSARTEQLAGETRPDQASPHRRPQHLRRGNEQPASREKASPRSNRQSGFGGMITQPAFQTSNVHRPRQACIQSAHKHARLQHFFDR